MARFNRGAATKRTARSWKLSIATNEATQDQDLHELPVWSVAWEPEDDEFVLTHKEAVVGRLTPDEFHELVVESAFASAERHFST
jgi:hypothetical protein